MACKITPSKHSSDCPEHLTDDSFDQNIAASSFLGTLFQASSTQCTQERRGTDDF